MSTKYLTYNKDIDYINAINKLASPYNHNNYAYNDKNFLSKCQIYEFHPKKFIKKGGKTKKRKNIKNKSKKRKGGGDNKLIEQYKIEEPTEDDYKNAFGDENGILYFNNKHIYPYSLYKIPITGINDRRIKCAAKEAKKAKEENIPDIPEDEILYSYSYVINDECKYGFCEPHTANNKYQRLLNKSNPYSKKKPYYNELIKCINENKNNTISPRSVAVEFDEEKENENENENNNNIFNNFNTLTLGGRKKNKKRRRRTKKRKS
jgi:hypothetical protein